MAEVEAIIVADELTDGDIIILTADAHHAMVDAQKIFTQCEDTYTDDAAALDPLKTMTRAASPITKDDGHHNTSTHHVSLEMVAI